MALKKREARLRAEEYPSSDGVPMDNERHRKNIGTYLLDPLELWCQRTGFNTFVGSNSFVYYGASPKHDVVGPDLYVVNGGVNRGQASWIVSKEQGLLPSLVMEFMSPTTRIKDQTTKLALYRDALRSRDYFLVDDGPTVSGFHLRGGVYVSIEPNSQGRLACSSLPLEVGVHDGWVRFFEPDGQLVPTGYEIVEANERQALAEPQRALAEHQRAEALALELAMVRAELERLKATRPDLPE